MKKIFWLLFAVIHLAFVSHAMAETSKSPVPDTGQTKCYDVAGKEITCPSPGQALYGQDANYSINPMSYTKLDSSGNALADSATAWSMVRDNVTGLVWEMKTNKDGVKNYNDPHDADNTYTWYDSNPATNGGNAGTPGNGTDTEDFIKALNDAKYGGFSDWRLPTIKELAYIVNYSIPYPGPTINTDYFPNTVASYYWSSTTVAYYTDYAWGVYFYYGYDVIYEKINYSYVRAVRGGQSGLLGDLVVGSFDTWGSETIGDAAAAGSYTDNGNGTVTDTSTGLMWRQAGSSNEMTWEQALAYCEDMDFGGYTDWRLPTIKELRSLVDYSRFNPAINTTYFPNTVASFYWSSFYWTSTTNANDTDAAWGVPFYGGDDYFGHKNSSSYVRAVRGGQSGSLGNLVISPLSRAVTKDAGTTMFSVSNSGTGTMPWSAVVTSGGDWLRITSGNSGTNTGTINCAFDANTGSSSRTGTIRVTADGATGSPKDVVIIQSATSVSARQFWGSWSDGVWMWSKASNQWTKMPSTAGAQMIAAGKVLGNPQDDLIGVWSSGLWVRCATSGQWTRLSATRPQWIVTADMNNDGRDDIVASWPNDGLYCRDSATSQWTKLSSAARQLAAGNFGGIRDDLAGVWNDGLWVRYSTNASWQKIDGSIPVWIAAGDMTGDKQAGIIGSYGSGTWYRNSATAAWSKITTPASQLAAGDLDGDGRDDLIGIWSDGVWVRFTASNQWQQITSSKPSWITTGTTAVTAQTSGAQNDPLESEKNVIDLSDYGPGGQNAIVIILDDTNPERIN